MTKEESSNNINSKKGNNSMQKVISNSIVYSISGLLLKCFSFFLLPLYTAYLSTEDYGIINIANSFLATMGFVVAFSLYSAVMRFYVDLKDDIIKLKRFYGSIVIFVFASSLAFFVLFSIGRSLLCKYVFLNIDFYPIVVVCLLTLVVNCQQTIYDNILRSQQKAMKSSIMTFVYFFLQVGLTILFVVYFKLGAFGALTATLIATVVYTICFWLDMIIHRSITFCVDWRLLKDALKYSLPIMPHNLSTYIATLISSVLIGNTASVATLGIYSVAAQFGNIADTIQSYVNNAYAPWLYERLHDRDSGYKNTIRTIANSLTAVIGFFLIGIALFAQDYILLFLDTSYHDAWRFVPLIVSVYTIKIVYYFYVNVLFYFKKASRILFVSTLTSSMVNILLSSFLIPLFGAYGSILADAIAMIVRVIIIVCISRKFEYIGLSIIDFIRQIVIIFIAIYGGMSISYMYSKSNFSILNFLFKVIVILGYAGIYCYIYRKQFIALIHKIRKKVH